MQNGNMMDDKPFLVIKNTFPKSSISQIMSNYFRKFINMNAHNESKVYVSSNEEIDDALSASGKMERETKFQSNSFRVHGYHSAADRNDYTMRTTVSSEPSGRSVVPKLQIPMPREPPPPNLKLPAKKKRFTALIVDDSLVHRKILNKLFSQNGFDVAELTDGMEVVEVMRRVMQTLPRYKDHFMDHAEDERSQSVKVMHEVIESNLTALPNQVDSSPSPTSISGGNNSRNTSSSSTEVSPRERTPKDRRRSATSPTPSLGAASSPMSRDHRRSHDHLANYYSDTVPSSSCSTARHTPRLLQFALTNHKVPGAGPTGTGSHHPVVALEDTVVDSLAPQIMLKIRKENIDLHDFIESREQVIHSIDNEEFNESYFQQTLGERRNSDTSHSDSSDCSIMFHPRVGVVGRQKSIVREMTFNSPRVMNNILTHLSHLHEPHTIMYADDGGPLHVESMDSTVDHSAPRGVAVSANASPSPSLSSGSSDLHGRSSKSNKMLSSMFMKNSMTNRSHVYSDSMTSALNITRAFNVIAHDDWDCIDVIIMDFVMVNMNGPEAVQHIRDMGYTGLIIGLTAKALSNDINIFLIHGVDAVFSKPLNWNLFMETFEILHRQNHINHHGVEMT